MRKIIPVLDRLADRTVEVPCLVNTLHPRCWVFTGAASGRYPRISYKGSARNAPKIAYELTIGPVPDAMVLMSLCATRSCWNPDHFRPATRKEVVAYHGVAAAVSQHFKEKTHCKRGHEFTTSNTRKGNRGQRICIECQKANGKKWHAAWISTSKNPPRNEESRERQSAECRRLRASGMKVRQIAEAMLLAESTVYERLKMPS